MQAKPASTITTGHRGSTEVDDLEWSLLIYMKFFFASVALQQQIENRDRKSVV